MTKPEPNDFLKTLEDGVRSVLNDGKSTPAEKIAAITAGTKIAVAQGKIQGDGDGKSNFFAKKRR